VVSRMGNSRRHEASGASADAAVIRIASAPAGDSPGGLG
jgi:hypothetical protein